MIDTQHEAAVIWSLDFDAELPCEGKHVHTECSHVAKFVLTAACGSIFALCKNGAEGKMKRADEGSICKGCMKPALECWSIRPI